MLVSEVTKLVGLEVVSKVAYQTNYTEWGGEDRILSKLWNSNMNILYKNLFSIFGKIFFLY